MFGAFFVAYIVNRVAEVDVFNASQMTLDRRLGLLNTVLLVTSSWTVVCALEAARHNRVALAARYLAAAIAFACGFVGVKIFEYSDKLAAEITLTTDTFYMFYYCLTGIHLLHVLAGTVILIVLWTNTRAGAYDATNMKGLETGASYWHMVDLLWIFLFALLYLLR